MLEQYLAHIARLLPPSKRNDIVAELREELDSRIEAREHDLGRPLNEDELAELIASHGRPSAVAARYYDGPQLIGQDLMPFYALVIRVILVVSIVALFAAAATRAIALDNASAFLAYMGDHWESPIFALAFVTLLFVLFDRWGKRQDRPWDPRALRPIDAAAGVSRWTQLSDLGFNVAFVAVLVLFVSRWSWVAEPYWHPIYVALLASSTINAIADVATMIAAAPAFALAGRILASAVNAAGLLYALAAVGPDDIALRSVFAVFLVISILAAAYSAYKLVRRAKFSTV